MNAKTFLLGASAVAVAAAPVRADEDHGLQFALRIGFSLPFGDITGFLPGSGGEPSGGFRDSYSGFIPMTGEVGWRINPNILVGALFQYAYGLARNSARNCDPYKTGRISCSGSDLLLGVESVYYFGPRSVVNPWAGIGTGYEWLGFSSSQPRPYGDVYAKGFQFINLHFGIDFPVKPGFYLAPYLTFALGKYTKFGYLGTRDSSDIPYTALHELLTIGLRGSFNL